MLRLPLSDLPEVLTIYPDWKVTDFGATFLDVFEEICSLRERQVDTLEKARRSWVLRGWDVVSAQVKRTTQLNDKNSKKVHRLPNIGSSIHFGASELEVGYWKGLHPFRYLLIHMTERRWTQPLCNLR